MTTDATDAELVDGVRQGSRDAAERLAQRYLRSCRAIALAIIGDIPGAEDASQDAAGGDLDVTLEELVATRPVIRIVEGKRGRAVACAVVRRG